MNSREGGQREWKDCRRKRALPRRSELARLTYFCCISVIYKKKKGSFRRSQPEDSRVLTMSFLILSTATCKAIRHKNRNSDLWQNNKMTVSWNWRWWPASSHWETIFIPDLCVSVYNMFSSFYILRRLLFFLCFWCFISSIFFWGGGLVMVLSNLEGGE